MRSRLIALLLLTVAAAYLASSMRQGWIPHDDGLLAATAERVLRGELPHTDYVDLYTGGLSYFHAAVFAVLGARLSSLRFALFAGSLLAIFCFYRAATRFVSPLAAAAATFMAVAWSLANYFAALPSWYTLFFTLCGLLALLESLEADPNDGWRRWRWVFLAGGFAGLSLTFKVTGLYFILAALLFLIFDVQLRGAKSSPPGVDGGGGRVVLSDLVVAVMPLLTLLCLLALVSYRLDLMNVVHFVVPGLALACVPLAERLRGGSALRIQWTELAAALAPFVAGVTVPVAILLGWTWLQGGMDAVVDLYRGVFVTPRLRLTFAQKPLPPWGSLLLGLPFALLFVPRIQAALSRRRLWVPLGLVLLGLLGAGGSTLVYQSVWASVRPLVPLFAALTIWQLARNRGPSGSALAGRSRSRLYLVATSAAFFSLIQIPYSTAAYFVYAAPLVLLLALALLGEHSPGRPVQACLAGFYLLFALIWLNGADVRAFGVRYQPRGELVLFDAERANLEVPRIHQEGYGGLLALVEEKSRQDDFIWAGPDAPEVYFLSGKRNPTRTYFDFFQGDGAQQGEEQHGEEMRASFLRELDDAGVNLVVLNTRPEFSPPLDPALLSDLAERYPQGAQLGPMIVRWRTRLAAR